VAPYSSGRKLAWLLDHVEGAREGAAAGRLAFGTVDTYLLARLTGGRAHATDHTNASRTMLYDIHRLAWDEELLDRLRIPSSLLPEVRPSCGRFAVTDPDVFLGASIPVSGIAGDQQASLFGQACVRAGDTKNTYGTGSVVPLPTAPAPAPPRPPPHRHAHDHGRLDRRRSGLRARGVGLRLGLGDPMAPGRAWHHRERLRDRPAGRVRPRQRRCRVRSGPRRARRPLVGSTRP